MASLKYKTENGYESLPAQVVTKTNAENGNGIGTCSTSSGTALTVSLTGYELVTNGFVAVTFSNDVPASATLNINGKGAKPIIYKGSAITADTIKADDTVMFCYNGSQYVVTSLGGETGEDGEIVVVRCSANDGASVSGKTVTINGTQYTLDDTGVVSAKVPFGTQYTVVAGSWTDYYPPSTQNFTASLVLREVNLIWTYMDVIVDLGLPSGTKWAVGNIVSDGNEKYKIGAETDRGAYASWGNVTPHFSSNGSTFDDSYNWGLATGDVYKNTQGYNIPAVDTTGASFAPNSGYDIVHELLGGYWRMPTKANFQELINNTTSEWTTKSGVVGREFTSNINGAKIFFPAVGMGQETSVMFDQQYGIYHSSSSNDWDNDSRGCYSFRVQQNNGADFFNYYRFRGNSIRPVI